jgi:hypothetical protein
VLAVQVTCLEIHAGAGDLGMVENNVIDGFGSAVNFKL